MGLRDRELSLLEPLIYGCLEKFLHNADLKCLPSTQENSWHNNKTRRTDQAEFASSWHNNKTRGYLWSNRNLRFFVRVRHRRGEMTGEINRNLRFFHSLFYF